MLTNSIQANITKHAVGSSGAGSDRDTYHHHLYVSLLYRMT